MAGRFRIGKYETNDGEIHPIRVQPETIDGDNPLPGAGITKSTYARVTGSKRAYGLKARYATYSLEIGTDADYSGAKVYAKVPYFLASAWIALNVGSTVTYQGKAWEVVSKTDESIR